MMFRHQRIGSRQHGRDCRLLRASRVSVALLALAGALLICGLAGAVDYGEINVTTANWEQWSTNLSNNVSTVQGNIIVNDGAVLEIENATVKMDSTDPMYSIIVRDNGMLNVNGSTITRYDDYYYGWRYESGSRGNVTNATVKFCIYNGGFKIETNESVSLYNVTFDHGHQSHPTGNCYGIYLNTASNTSIRNCTIKTSSSLTYRYTYGIYIQNSIFCNLTGNRITDSINDGIFMQSSDNATLLANNLTGNRDGIYLNSCPDSSLSSNTVADSSKHGINITSSRNCILRSNSITNCTGYYHLYVTGDYYQDIDTSNIVNGGRVYYNYSDSDVVITDTNIGHVTIVDCTNLWFTGCTIHNGDGIRIRGVSSNVSIRGSTIENNTVYGINLESTSWNDITSVTIENNTKQGIYLVDSSNNLINDSDILDNSNYGVHSEGSSSYNNVSYNNITNNTLGGMRIDGSGHDDITYNNVSENRGSGGICVGTVHYSSESTHNTLHNNTISSNNDTGIGLYTNYNYLSNNTISSLSGQYALKVSYVKNSFYNYIWRNNTANDEQINYYYDEHDKITELADNIIENKCLSAHNVSNVGKITLIDCTNLTVRDNELSNNSLSSSYGIFLRNSNNNNLTNNTISNNCNGIWLYNSSENNITDLDTISPSNQYGAHFEENSDHNNITDSSFAATNSHGMSIAASSDHITVTNTTISSVNADGASVSGSYASLTNVTITSSETDGLRIGGDHTTIAESGITASNTGVHCTSANHTDIINTTITAGTNGINMSQSHWGNLTNNTIDAASTGIFLTTSRGHNVTANNVTNYTVTGILLEEYSTNNTMIGNNLTWDGSEFDIILNDSNGCVIANNESVTANYTFYLTNDTRLCTLDTVFNKTKVGYGDNESNLTLMWRIDVLCWDNYHRESLKSNLTVQYSDLSNANGSLCWDGEISAGADENPDMQGGRLSGNLFDYWGPPTSSDNWISVIEYKQNVSGKTTYQPMNCTAINYWDVLQEIYDRTYRNVTTMITEPGITICVDTGYTPNSKCYYCHEDKYTFVNTAHWTKYEMYVEEGTEYTPGRCIDCHDENDSIDIPHGNVSGKDLLYSQSPQLCYTGRTGGLKCHSANATAPLDQEREFNQTTHHPLGDGKLACKACHDNHGTDYDSDLLKKYTTYTSSPEQGYNSNYYALCLVCHLEEKLVAKMSGETGHLANYMNQTNFRSEYWYYTGFSGVRLQNIHSPQGYQAFHPRYNCYACHNPHGSDNPATTRYKAKKSKTTYYNILNFTYITNLTPPINEDPGDYLNQTILDQANWSNPTMNQGGGLYIPPGGAGCVCHQEYDEYGNLRHNFIYREFVDYEPAGGAGCLECHDNNASAYNTTPIRPIVNLTAVKLAMHTNLSGAFRTGSILQGTDRNFTKWLENRTYTPAQIANITEDNAICWACHSTNGTPPSPGFHPDRALTPYKCPKCHGPYDGQPPHTQGLVAAIDNHGPTTKGAESILIQTDVGNGGSCGDCHAPSVLSNDSIDDPGTSDDDLEVWKWNGYGGGSHERPYDGRTTMGDVSHYGLNKSQGEDLEIDNPLCDTTDCLFCHCNWTNGQIWGNATNISENMYGADTTDLSTCYTYCHVRPDWVGSVNNSTLSHFHNESIYAGGGPNCTLCHDIGSEYGVQSLVNATAIAEGIHGNMLNNTLVHDGYGMDNRSNPCWGCHNSDGTIPEGMGDRNGITDSDDSTVIEADELPYTCEDCHARSDVWNSATSDGETWQSASDPDLGLNKLPPLITDHYPNSTLVKTNDQSDNGRCVDCHNNSIDSDNNDTRYKILGHTIFSGVSHYGTSDGLLTPTRMCRYCHNNTTNASNWGNAIQNDHGIDETDPVDGCYFCHTHNETPVDFHNMNVVSIPGDPDCLRCHGEDGNATRRRINETVYEIAIHARMNNATTGVNGTNQSCWVCHFPEGLGMEEHSNRRKPAYHCYDCHNEEAEGPFINVSGAPNVYNHFKDSPSIEAYWLEPTKSESCMGCHNQSEMMYDFVENDTYRTAFSITSHYGDNRTDIVDLYPANSTEYCAYCHINTSTPFTIYPNSKNIRHAGGVDCSDSDCHGPGRLHESTLTRVNTTGNCTDCHALYGANKSKSVYEVNVSAIGMGVHDRVNENMNDTAESVVGDENNSRCWGCHVPDGRYPATGHNETFNNDAYLCYDCHNGTSAYQNVSTATAVYNHFKEGINIRARTNAETNSASCGFGCHNATTMKVANFNTGANSTYRVNMSQASHYTRNRTEDIANVSGGYSDCTWCHKDPDNEFIDIFERPNTTANILHGTETAGCIDPACHDRGRIHDLNLTIPTPNWAEECANCHFNYLSGKYYVNETMFDLSVHKEVNCTECHISALMDHPLEEYTWKWCECCHSYQADPLNETDRHNVTTDPANYMVGGTSVLAITNCTECHDAVAYENAKQNFNKGADRNCRWCHSYPDM